MSDFENDIFNLEGDALDEALLAAIEATDEEARLEREERIRKNQERAEQARITAIEQEKRRQRSTSSVRICLTREEDISLWLRKPSAPYPIIMRS